MELQSILRKLLVLSWLYLTKSSRPGYFSFNSLAYRTSLYKSLHITSTLPQAEESLHQSIESLEFITPLGSRTRKITLRLKSASRSNSSTKVILNRTVFISLVGIRFLQEASFFINQPFRSILEIKLFCLSRLKAQNFWATAWFRISWNLAKRCWKFHISTWQTKKLESTYLDTYLNDLRWDHSLTGLPYC